MIDSIPFHPMHKGNSKVSYCPLQDRTHPGSNLAFTLFFFESHLLLHPDSRAHNFLSPLKVAYCIVVIEPFFVIIAYLNNKHDGIKNRTFSPCICVRYVMTVCVWKVIQNLITCVCSFRAFI